MHFAQRFTSKWPYNGKTRGEREREQTNRWVCFTSNVLCICNEFRLCGCSTAFFLLIDRIVSIIKMVNLYWIVYWLRCVSIHTICRHTNEPTFAAHADRQIHKIFIHGINVNLINHLKFLSGFIAVPLSLRRSYLDVCFFTLLNPIS